MSKCKFSQWATQICLTSPSCIKSHWSLLKPYLEVIWFSFLNYVWTSLYLLACNYSRARKGEIFSFHWQVAYFVECCTMSSLYQSFASTFPIKFLHSSKVPQFLHAALHSPQTPPCLTKQGIHMQQTSDSIPGPVPWQCPSTKNHADSPVLGEWNKLSKNDSS